MLVAIDVLFFFLLGDIFHGFMLVFGGCIFWLGWGGEVEIWCC